MYKILLKHRERRTNLTWESQKRQYTLKKADFWNRPERWAWHFPHGVLGRIPLSVNNPTPFWMFITTASSLPYEAHFTLNSCNCCKCTFSIVPNGAFYYFCSWVPVFSSGANGQRLTFPPYKSFLYLKIDTMFTFKLSLFHIGKGKWIKSPVGFPERWSEMKLVHRRFRRECSAVPHTLNGRVGVDRGRNTVWDMIFFIFDCARSSLMCAGSL